MSKIVSRVVRTNCQGCPWQAVTSEGVFTTWTREDARYLLRLSRIYYAAVPDAAAERDFNYRQKHDMFISEYLREQVEKKRSFRVK